MNEAQKILQQLRDDALEIEQDDEKDEDYTSGSDEESEDIDEGEMSEELFTVVKTREGFYKLM